MKTFVPIGNHDAIGVEAAGMMRCVQTREVEQKPHEYVRKADVDDLREQRDGALRMLEIEERNKIDFILRLEAVEKELEAVKLDRAAILEALESGYRHPVEPKEERQ